MTQNVSGCDLDSTVIFRYLFVDHCFPTFKMVMGVRRGGKTGISPPLEIWTKNQNFAEDLKSQA